MAKGKDIEALRNKIAELTGQKREEPKPVINLSQAPMPPAPSYPTPSYPAPAQAVQPNPQGEEMNRLRQEYEAKLKSLEQESLKNKEIESDKALEDVLTSEEEQDEPSTENQRELMEKIEYAVEQYQNNGKFRLDLINQLILLNQNIAHLVALLGGK